MGDQSSHPSATNIHALIFESKQRNLIKFEQFILKDSFFHQMKAR